MNACTSLAVQPGALEEPGSQAMPDRTTGPRQRLIEMVEKMLARNAVSRPVSVDDQLSEAGLSSLDMVNLMLAVEAEFHITIPASDITPANFRCISTIEVLVTRIVRRTARA
jgi:acyl carrier protein